MIMFNTKAHYFYGHFHSRPLSHYQRVCFSQNWDKSMMDDGHGHRWTEFFLQTIAPLLSPWFFYSLSLDASIFLRQLRMSAHDMMFFMCSSPQKYFKTSSRCYFYDFLTTFASHQDCLDCHVTGCNS